MVQLVNKVIIYKLNGQHVLFVQVLQAHVPMQPLSNHVKMVSMQLHLVDKMLIV